MALPTVDQLQADARSAVEGRCPRLTDWTTGSANDAYTWAAALVAQEIIEAGVQQVGKLFFGTAEGDDLVALGQDRLGGNLPIQAASPAVGEVTFSRPSSTFGSVTIDAGTELTASAAPGLVFVTTETVALVGTSIAASVACTTTGGGGNLAAESIDTISDTLPDSSITVSQADRLVGGAPRETDPQYRGRIANYYQSLQRGTTSALAAGALTVEGCRVAVVDERYIAAEDGGYVLVLVGDADGESNPTLEGLVDEELENWRSAGVMVQVQGVARLPVLVTVALRLTTPRALGIVTPAIQAALEAYGLTLTANDTLYISQLERVVINTSPRDRGGYIIDADVSITVEDPAEGTVTLATDYTPSFIGVVLRIDAEDVAVSLGV